MSYNKDMSGTLGKNDRKSQKTHPDYRGKCMVGGQEFWISAWIKEGPTGKFFSLAFQPKDPSPAVSYKVDQDDDIPF